MISGPRPTKSRGRPLAPKTVALRERILELPGQYEAMTVRGVYYQCSTGGVVPKTEAGYRAVQRQVLKLRHEGRLDWSFISDATRWVRRPETWSSAEDALRATARLYRGDLWRGQGQRVEVWLEKDALAGLLSDVTYQWNVALMVSRGVSSSTFIYAAAQEAKRAWQTAGVETVLFGLFDYDAGGQRASDKVERGLCEHADGVPISYRRLGVTEDQIAAWNLPTRPAKKSDPQAKSFGAEAVELDAIPPDRLTGLVENAIVDLIDPHAWKIEQTTEREEREILERLVDYATGGAT